jgi:hypothetical protein
MSSLKKLNQIKRSDYDRILVTETLPHETPIIFSNDGLRDKLANIDSGGSVQSTLLRALIKGEGVHKLFSTIPLLYQIRKNSMEFRRLALLHPISQWKIRKHYEKYEQLILHYCSLSPASIRSPNGIAGSFYSKNSWENIHQYKRSGISLTSSDRFSKHSPTFFSYRGHDRLYKFFDSKEYFELEKTFPILWTLDVSKCFDSIYTHSLSWAVKDKEFTKENVLVSSTFAQEFDEVIRHGNHNETHGIPIGPESSRVFAEILFQEIDDRVILRMNDVYKRTFGIEYSFRRYVDDVFIFASNEEIAKKVYNCYSDVLLSFNLHANLSKSLRMVRPFLTKKSRLIRDASQIANDFFAKFLTIQLGSSALEPVAINSPWRLSRSFLESVKSLCSYNDADYDEVSSFLIAVITERIKKLVNINLEDAPAHVHSNYRSAVLVLLDVLYFLYGVAPSVGASYKLCTAIILISRFTNQHIPDHENTISQRIYELTASLMANSSQPAEAAAVDRFIHLEVLNIVLAARELGDNYLLPEPTLNKLFLEGDEYSYFKIVSCLYYVKNEPQYASIREKVIQAVIDKLANLSDVFMNSEKAHLLLDMLACPYLPENKKKDWVKAIYTVLQVAEPTSNQMTEFIGNATVGHWQINWSEVDLLTSLEKKELNQAY